MVLQTSCRCLRQVIKNGQETALIYLNESNAEKLNMQLERQHHISLKEFSSADNSKGCIFCTIFSIIHLDTDIIYIHRKICCFDNITCNLR